MIQEISVRRVETAVDALFTECTRLPDPNLPGLLRTALAKERSDFGREILTQLLKNIEVAAQTGLPLCQDTGMAVVFLDIGQDVHFYGGDLMDAIYAGVRRAYGNGLRKSVLTALSRENTGDNTPAVVHTRLIPGEAVDLWVAPKGFGSENMSRIAMLPPSAGVDGVLDFVVETVQKAGANPCPPVVLGVAVGGTFEQAAELSKRQLLRPLGEPSPDPFIAALEAEMLARVNALGIGPMGLGGDTTALAVHLAQTPTHLAGLPVAVNVQCHCVRHGHIRLTAGEETP